MDRYVAKLNNERNLEEKAENIVAIIKIIATIAICVLLLLAVKYGIQYQEENFYDIVNIGGKDYYSTDHNIEIYDGHCVVIDDTEYGWSYVNYIRLHQKRR